MDLNVLAEGFKKQEIIEQLKERNIPFHITTDTPIDEVIRRITAFRNNIEKYMEINRKNMTRYQNTINTYLLKNDVPEISIKPYKNKKDRYERNYNSLERILKELNRIIPSFTRHQDLNRLIESPIDNSHLKYLFAQFIIDLIDIRDNENEKEVINVGTVEDPYIQEFKGNKTDTITIFNNLRELEGFDKLVADSEFETIQNIETILGLTPQPEQPKEE